MLTLSCAQVPVPLEPAAAPPPVAEASIAELQKWMDEGRLTSRQLVETYLERIERYEPSLHAAISIRADALAVADRLDRERLAGRTRGPLHGIPIALKDNIHTTVMPTTAGAVAFADLVPPFEATLTRNLREAGAIIFAKTTLTELANWMASDMPDGYNAVSGFSMNPYDPRQDPRSGFDDGRPVLSPGGSSSGVGTAAGLWAASVGTETSGSISIPSNYNMLVGIKPTLGRISRHGIVPIAAEQDTPGPMARDVADAAVLLGALEGTGPDPSDPASGVCERPPGVDYTRFLDRGGLRGARIGVPRAFFYDPVTLPGEDAPRGGISDLGRALMQAAIETLREAGAIIVDPVEIPSIVDPDPEKNLLRFPPCAGEDPRTQDDDCSIVMKYGMKRDFNAWLDSLGDVAPVASLTELREFNREHADDLGTMAYGQAVLDVCDEMDGERDRSRFEQDRARDLFLTREHGLDVPLSKHDLDALLIPSWLGETLHSRSGYPSISVPFALIPNRLDPPAPAGFHPRPLPNGVTFTGPACSEPRLIELAYAFEQATLRRIPPPEFP
jgi:amidase